ncbi:MAG: DNA repair protein RadA [Phycisphaerales bacterium]|nr:DNA repair protein RadA [Phycisphaerales bacterium]
MAKTRHVFICRACGALQHRWMGKCPDCGEWDSLEDQVVDPSAAADPHLGAAKALAQSFAAEGGDATPAPAAKPLDDIGESDGPAARITCGIHELDRVLGGGLVPGSAVLCGGEPGIGKSTLLLQAARAWAALDRRVLYVSSEESAQQIKMRAQRLLVQGGTGVPAVPITASARANKVNVPRGTPHADSAGGANLFILADANLARIVEQTRKVQPEVLVIDSVQMIYKADLPASPGSITQLRRCCAELVYLAKLSGVAVVMVGHVTKEGQLAGPRLLEHLVDAVLYFEGDRYHAHRVVRAVKNRFGTTLEIGLFEMTGQGLLEATEGAGVSAVSGDGPPRPGSVVSPVITGTRCVLVELQALTATGFLGAAKRKSSGLDANRLAMLIAVLEQHGGLRLADRDVFASAVGGIRVIEPASDLALLLAIAGAHYRRALPPTTAAVGEVGLGGEVRAVGQLEQRINEASRMGYERLIIPWIRKSHHRGAESTEKKGIEVVMVKTVGQAIEQLG